MYLTNAMQSYVFEICFEKKTQKTRLSRLNKELNDLCACIYKVNKKQITDWIIFSTSTFNKVNASFKINYVSLYCTLKVLRNKVLKTKELQTTTEHNLKQTTEMLKILNDANNAGYIQQYQAIRRKYYNRKQSQKKKIEKHSLSYNYACTIRFFFIWIAKIIASDKQNYNANKELCNELDIELISEFINEQIENSFE